MSRPAFLFGLNSTATQPRRGKGGSAKTSAPPPRFPTEAFLLFHVVLWFGLPHSARPPLKVPGS